MTATSAHPVTSNVVLRLNEVGQPDPSGLTYWDVETVVKPDRTHYDVRHDGWTVAEVYDGPDGWRVASKPREPIPAAVLAEVPDVGRDLLVAALAAERTEG